MSESGRQTPPQSLIGTSFSPAGGSRPFLNLLNPIGRHYHGYTPAGLLQEVDDPDDGVDDEGTPRGSTYSSKVEQVPLSDLQPSAARRGHAVSELSDDDEVPQSFLIEANPAPTANSSRPGRTQASKPSLRRASSSKHPPPILPTHRDPSHRRQVLQDESRERSVPKPFTSGLDKKEQALWNWVNVYNLDAYLQDVSLAVWTPALF
jgi:autophagy-related protein 9